MAESRVKSGVLADAFLSTSYMDESGNRLLHLYKGRFWRYATNKYVQVEDSTILKQFMDYLEKNNCLPSRSNWSTLKELLEYRVMLTEEQKMPALIGESEINTDMIAFENTLMSVKTHNTMDHTPMWFSGNCLPFRYDPEAQCPLWLKKLDEIFTGDPERIAQLQEWFGYCLTPDTSLHTALLLQGRGRSGKSTIVKILGHLLGKDNVSNVRLDLFAERFSLSRTEGKLVNVAEEANKSQLFDEGRFKSLVAGEVIQVEDKGRHPRDIVSTARMVMTANEDMAIRDISGAVYERLLLIPFYISFKGKEDRGLEKKLVQELPGIFNWALEGHKRIHQTQQFTTSKVGQAELGELRESNNHLYLWQETNIETREGAEESSRSIYQNYKRWCREAGIQKPISENNLARAFRRTMGLPPTWKPSRAEHGEPGKWPGYVLKWPETPKGAEPEE